jgi:serine/threonine protein phosphatase PrpC
MSPSPSATGREVESYGRSDVGLVRESNQDAFIVGDLDLGQRCQAIGATAVLRPGQDDAASVATISTGPKGPFLVVCDGMGGVEGGEVAAAIAVATIWAEMRDVPIASDPQVYARLLRRAVRAANRRVVDEGERRGLLGMGTTVSAAGFVGARLVLAQVGDSRVYVLRHGVLTQVTRDQSLASAFALAGKDAAAQSVISSGAILQALGVGPDVEPSLSIIDLRRGDRILLCSDGLHGVVDEPVITEALSDPRGLVVAVDSLIIAANLGGGGDNVTAVVAEVRGDALPAPSDEDDLPRYLEFDPHEEGEDALTSTSHVVRRLAARAGLGADPHPKRLPATGQYMAVVDTRPPSPRRALSMVEPPTPAVTPTGRRQLWLWMGLAVVVASVAWALAGLVY